MKLQKTLRSNKPQKQQGLLRNFRIEELLEEKKLTGNLYWIDYILLTFSLLCFILIIYDLGFLSPGKERFLFHIIIYSWLAIYFIYQLFVVPNIFKKRGTKYIKFSNFLFSLLSVIQIFKIVGVLLYFSGLVSISWLYTGHYMAYIFTALVFLIELSKVSHIFYSLKLNPALLFVLSFAIVILVGAIALSMPNCTADGKISFIDSFFTSCSAVCVTGLIVVDTSQYFTYLGKIVILLLIQIGGIGVMTFTSFFMYFFKGSTSYHDQLILQESVSAEKMGEVFRTIFKITFYTFGIELVGAIFIFFNIKNMGFDLADKIQFAIFHSVSAFCNAGFSTLTDGIYDIGLRFNYFVQIVICFLIIIGGIGFPVILNLHIWLKTNTINRFNHLVFRKRMIYYPRLINVNTKIAIYTTVILLILGTILFRLLENNNVSLTQHATEYGKWVVSFFNSTTPRTAGFNNINMATMLRPTVLIIMLLMWIGASPVSTGGGIKTTTLAVSVLNIFSLGRGKGRIELYMRKIRNDSERRAMATIFLSLLVIGSAAFAIIIFDPNLSLIMVLFECISAYSTVGLSLGITALLSAQSKIIIIICMFLGRVGTLSFILGLIPKVSTQKYSYPKESIIIN